MINRLLMSPLKESLSEFPAVGLVGPRQVGKTTLSRQLLQGLGMPAIWLDLENPDDLAQLGEPGLFLRSHQDKLVVLDEVQRMPELFPLLRVLIDERRVPGRFLILGSASPELLRQSSESLAGRIAYHELPPLLLPEVGHLLQNPFDLLMKGGYPLSFLAKDDGASLRWRKNFIKSYTERELQLLGFGPDPVLALRFLRMIASVHGQVWNAQSFAKSLDLTHPTINKYRNFLDSAYMLRVLQPYSANLKKRLVKSPKVYIRDSGMLHALLDIADFTGLMGQSWSGHSWEGYAIEQVIHCMPDNLQPFFMSTHQGAEIDLLLIRQGKPYIALEMKFSNAPKLPKGFTFLIDELNTSHNFIVTPGTTRYPVRKNVEVIALKDLLGEIKRL